MATVFDYVSLYPLPSTGSGEASRYSEALKGLLLDPASASGVYMTSEQEKLEAEVIELRKKERELVISLQRAQKEGLKKDTELELLKTVNEEMKRKQDLAYLLSRVTPFTEAELFKNESIRQGFIEQQDHEAFVVSIDVRRSTDLMLRGKTPQLYAQFLDRLCTCLVEVVKHNFGVIDKFTGDGLLAYFPPFFSGSDAGYRALATAQASHALFEKHYREARGSFTSILKDVGLGIGIDYGAVRLLRVTGELTVVGTAVVYACRLGGAPAGKTYLNHSAINELRRVCPDAFDAEEIDFLIKHEGDVICHDVKLAHASYRPTDPDWLKAAGKPAS